MTLFESLIANSLETFTSSCSLSTIDTTLDAAGTDIEYQTTTLLPTATTAASFIEVQEQQVIINNAQAYVESMSIEQLTELENELNNLIIQDDHTHEKTIKIDEVKVYTKQQ